jgi:hypothetical protein
MTKNKFSRTKTTLNINKTITETGVAAQVQYRIGNLDLGQGKGVKQSCLKQILFLTCMRHEKSF